MYQEKKILLEVKPIFYYTPAFITRLPISFFLTLWSTGFFGGIGFFILRSINTSMGFEMLPARLAFPIAGFGAFFLVQLMSLYWEKLYYEKTKYIFYEDELVYYEGYWGIQEKSISYKKIQEVSLSKGIFQQMYNLGTIKITTAANSEYNTGIQVKNIENPDGVYKFFKEIIKEK